MTDVVITVRGEHQQSVGAELAVARVAVRLDGADRSEVVTRASSIAHDLQEELKAAENAGTISKWNSERVSIWADRPWNNEGKQLDLVHHASVSTTSEWTDFSALSEWISAVSEREGVTVDGISWQLTKETASSAEREVAQRAIQVAVDRATAYAQALGLANVTATQVADVGLLGTNEVAMKAMPMMSRGHADMAGGASFELEPNEIEVSATVEARFAAN